MKRLPATARDREVLEAIGEWVQLLAEDRYDDANDFLYHPWLPGFPVNDLDAESIKQSISAYGSAATEQAEQVGGPARPKGPYNVTPVQTAAPVGVNTDRMPKQDIDWWDVPSEPLWDAVRVDRGGTLSGARVLGDIYFDIPFNDEWSDLTAIFDIVLYDGAIVLALQSIDVM